MAGLNVTTLEKFAYKTKRNRKLLLELLFYLKLKGAPIVGVSAPAKGNTLLNYCNIGTETIEYITEKCESKVGKVTPGTHIPIVPDDKLIVDQPEYALILAWNWKDQIIRNLREKGYKGKFIIPIPEPKVLDE